ncbi:MAG TPA: class I SAM-dependent methyltransferase [Thermoleophilaceae bacterium]|jgi:O-methyltransferase involved in polyketide biosynthesis
MSERISPTAHYTGYVWARNGLSHPELASWEGRVLFETVRPSMLVFGLLRGPTLEPYLLARHRGIDARLEDWITPGAQILEIAGGLSPRGWRFKRRHGRKIDYVEADLPDMAARKRQALARMGAMHRVEDLDVLRPGDLEELAATLDPGRPLAIITEGLLSYLDRDDVLDIWRRFAETLSGFSGGLYLSDLHVVEDASGPHVEFFRLLLSAFVRGQVRVHFEDAAEAVAALEAAGFAEAAAPRADSQPVRIVEASV